MTADADDTYVARVRGLAVQAARRPTNVYADIDWTLAEPALDPTDPRWRAHEQIDPLTNGRWYRSLGPAERSAVCLYRVAEFMKQGIEFENVLQQGLLAYASTLPNAAAEFRFVHHEIAEESAHSLMFQEFVNRTGFDIPGFPDDMRPVNRRVVAAGESFPELLFLVALAGEEPIDLVQRRMLDAPLHPLLERILRIHVRDESRHLSFARAFLRWAVPRLPDSRRREVRYALPYLARRITDRMVLPGAGLGWTFGLSSEALEAEAASGAFAELRGSATRRLFGLASELGLVTRRTVEVWRRLGLVEGGQTLVDGCTRRSRS